MWSMRGAARRAFAGGFQRSPPVARSWLSALAGVRALHDGRSTIGLVRLLHASSITLAATACAVRALAAGFPALSRARSFSARGRRPLPRTSRGRGSFPAVRAFDSSRSRTTFSYSRMSRRMPMAPMTLPSGSRRADALSVVGITSPLALRGLSRAFRVTPRSTTSRSAAVNPRVSSGLMNARQRLLDQLVGPEAEQLRIRRRWPGESCPRGRRRTPGRARS